MMTADEFKKYYEENLKELEDTYITETKKLFLTYALLIIINLAVSGFIYKTLNNSIAFILLVFIFAIASDCLKKYNNILKEYKYEVASKVIAFLSHNKKAGIKEKMMVSKKAISELELVNFEELKVFGTNYTVMSYGNFNIVLSDLKLLHFDNKGLKNEAFSGVYFSATFNKPINEQVHVIPNNMKDIGLNKFVNCFKYTGKRVILENNEFEKKYNVYSDDELQARYLISLRLMERINDIDKIFPGKKYIIFKKTGKISILFSGEAIKNKIHSRVNILLKGDTFRFSKEVFDYFSNYIEVYRILDLENKTYMLGV